VCVCVLRVVLLCMYVCVCVDRSRRPGHVTSCRWSPTNSLPLTVAPLAASPSPSFETNPPSHCHRRRLAEIGFCTAVERKKGGEWKKNIRGNANPTIAKCKNIFHTNRGSSLFRIQFYGLEGGSTQKLMTKCLILTFLLICEVHSAYMYVPYAQNSIWNMECNWLGNVPNETQSAR